MNTLRFVLQDAQQRAGIISKLKNVLCFAFYMFLFPVKVAAWLSSSRGFACCSLHVTPLLEKSGSECSPRGVVMVSAGSWHTCSTASIYRVLPGLISITVTPGTSLLVWGLAPKAFYSPEKLWWQLLWVSYGGCPENAKFPGKTSRN